MGYGGNLICCCEAAFGLINFTKTAQCVVLAKPKRLNVAAKPHFILTLSILCRCEFLV